MKSTNLNRQQVDAGSYNSAFIKLPSQGLAQNRTNGYACFSYPIWTNLKTSIRPLTTLVNKGIWVGWSIPCARRFGFNHWQIVLGRRQELLPLRVRLPLTELGVTKAIAATAPADRCNRILGAPVVDFISVLPIKDESKESISGFHSQELGVLDHSLGQH